MKGEIIIVTDYQGRFGTRYKSNPYRSGFDLRLLEDTFNDFSFNVRFINASELSVSLPELGSGVFIYTSTEDREGKYKSFLEDILFEISERGGILIPDYRYLRAHNNKVFFEITSKRDTEPGLFLNSFVYGTLEELIGNIEKIKYPVVVKSSEGFKSRGVHLAHSKKELLHYANRVSRSFHLFTYLKDIVRSKLHIGYKRESVNRNKFIIQDFVPGIRNDWKVLVYGKKYYVLRRENRKNDFRASGSGKFSYSKEVHNGLLEFCSKLMTVFNVPQASFDVLKDGETYYLLEAQFIYFGTYTIENSDFWYQKINSKWVVMEGPSLLEVEYARSIAEWINTKKFLK